jgi:hypothetical protein
MAKTTQARVPVLLKSPYTCLQSSISLVPYPVNIVHPLGGASHFLKLADATPPPHGLLSQTLRTADEGTAAFVESAQPMNVASDADSNRGADRAGGANLGSEPKFAASA